MAPQSGNSCPRPVLFSPGVLVSCILSTGASPSGAPVRVGKAKVNFLHLWWPDPLLASTGRQTEGHAGAPLPREHQGLAPTWLSYASVIQVLLFPGGCGDGTVWVHDDFGTANDHHYEEETKEDKAGQGQPLVHIDIDRLRRRILHLLAATVGSSCGSGLTGTIFHPCLLEWSPLHKDLGSGCCRRKGEQQDITAQSQ